MANIGKEEEEIEVTPISVPVEAPPVPAEPSIPIETPEKVPV